MRNCINTARIVRFLAAALSLFFAIAAKAGTVTVASTADAGGTCPGATCTLRQAIATAADGDTINFSLPPNSTITLTSGELALTSKNVVISGPGANLLTVQRSFAGGTPNFRIFNIGPSIAATLSGLTISNGTTANNTFEGVGGGILKSGAGTVTIANCAISGNSAYNSGGGIFNESAMMIITNCTISGNTARAAIGQAGGVFNNGDVTCINSTIASNTAAMQGGGILNRATATIINSTISLNSGSSGGGITAFPSATTNLRNTIVAGNSTNGGDPSVDVSGGFTSNGYNLIGSGAGSGGFTGPGDQVGVSTAQVNLSPLQDNGGPTKTMTLRFGSVAVDRGKNGNDLAGQPITVDQRGFPRTVDRPENNGGAGGDGTDIGAVEVGTPQLGPTFTVNTTGEANDGECTSDHCTLLDALSLSNAVADVNTINFASHVTGAIGTSNLTTNGLPVTNPVTINGPGARVLTVTGRNAARVFRVTSSNVTISGLSIINGRVTGDNGACIHNTGALTLTNCTVSSGLAIFSSAGGMGGGIYNAAGSSLTLNGCTLSNNSASTGHVGGNIHNAGILSATNTSILEGTATQGGGIYSEFSNNASKVSLLNCTITRCNATDMGTANGDGGGGLYFVGNSGQYDLANCIVAANTSQGGMNPDLRGNFTSKGHNLIGNVGFSTGLVDGTNADQVGGGPKPVKDARLDPVRRNNGGPTDTHALLSDSTAINAGGDALAPPTDQRGYGRNGVSDIGAFELAGFLPVTLANISTRLRVETGDNVLIGGFIVTGTQAKKIMVRAIGPSLSQFFSDTLSNPTLELRDGTGALLDSNDNWISSPNKQAIIDSGIAPSNDLESAIIATLPANGAGYTAIVRGVGDATGIGVVEAYDLDRSVDSKLANISTRGFVQTGNNVLIAGTIVVGTQSQKVIVRAIGPSLPLTGKLGNPTLELRDSNGGVVEANDNWIDSPNKQAIIDSTIPPANDLESAIVRTLSPAAYTAIVRGVNDTTGIAVVEVYALQ